LRELVRGAVTRARELGYALFVAMRYDASGNVDCFDAMLPAELAEFLAGCAKYAFPWIQFDDPRFGLPPLELDSIGDSELRGTLERAFARANDRRYAYFCALVIEPEGGRRDSICEYSIHANTGPEITAHLQRCFDVAMAACRPL
jgi:hypothetical protein